MNEPPTPEQRLAEAMKAIISKNDWTVYSPAAYTTVADYALQAIKADPSLVDFVLPTRSELLRVTILVPDGMDGVEQEGLYNAFLNPSDAERWVSALIAAGYARENDPEPVELPSVSDIFQLAIAACDAGNEGALPGELKPAWAELLDAIQRLHAAAKQGGDNGR